MYSFTPAGPYSTTIHQSTHFLVSTCSVLLRMLTLFRVADSANDCCSVKNLSKLIKKSFHQASRRVFSNADSKQKEFQALESFKTVIWMEIPETIRSGICWIRNIGPAWVSEIVPGA